MRLLCSLLLAFAVTACAGHDHDRFSDHQRWDDWRREAQARPPPCPGPTWQDGQQYPDGRWEPGRWQCNYPSGPPGYGYGGSGPDGDRHDDRR